MIRTRSLPSSRNAQPKEQHPSLIRFCRRTWFKYAAACRKQTFEGEKGRRRKKKSKGLPRILEVRKEFAEEYVDCVLANLAHDGLGSLAGGVASRGRGRVVHFV